VNQLSAVLARAMQALDAPLDEDLKCPHGGEEGCADPLDVLEDVPDILLEGLFSSVHHLVELLAEELLEDVTDTGTTCDRRSNGVRIGLKRG